MERVNSMVAERPVVIFSRSNCGICHSIKSLISGYGANAVVYELDEISRGKEIEQALARRLGQNPAIPVVFVSGELVGGADEVMTLHLGGILRQMLMRAGALWV